MAKRKQYSEREKQAYYAGKAYATAKAGKRFPCKTEEGKERFRNGVKSVRGKKKASRKTDIVCGITADGELVNLR